MAELQPGTLFAGHRIEGVAGRGGMGVVYRAMHLALDHEVALKVIAAEVSSDETFRARFRDEARSAASIRHPNVVSVRHAGEEDGMWFVTMDLIDGTDLRRLLRAEGPLEPERAVAVIEQVAAALDAAHRRGLVHRDVKPGNILIEPVDGTEHVYLTDFGLTKRIEETSGLTRTGAFVGTIDYCAPEQIQRGAITARTDVYALGCVLYEMLSGLTPFGQAEEDVAKIYAHLQREPAPVSATGPPGGVPTALDPIVARALAKSPDDRFPSAGELAAAARAALADADTLESTVEHGAPSAMTAEAAPPVEAATVVTPATPRRARRRLALLGLVAVLAGTGVIALVSGGGGGNGGVSLTRFDVDDFPVGVTVAGGEVWVGARRGEQVLHGDIGGEELDSIDLAGRSPEGLDTDGDVVWVASSSPGSITAIDVATGKPAEPIEAGEALRGLAVLDGRAWAADHDGNRVVRTEGRSVAVGRGPNGVAAGAGSIWVTNRDDNSVSRVDPLTTSTGPAIEVGRQPKGLVVAEGYVWVANTGDGTVSIIDPGTNAEDGEPIEVGDDPRDVAFGEGSVWVSNGAMDASEQPTGEGTVSRIDPETREVTDTIEVGGSPEDIAVGGGYVWVALGAGNELVRIDP